MMELIGYVPVLVMNPASLLNHERLTDDEAIELTLPDEPMYAKPCERDERFNADEKVDEAVERRPFKRPMVDVVDTPYVCAVNGKTYEVYPASLVN